MVDVSEGYYDTVQRPIKRIRDAYESDVSAAPATARASRKSDLLQAYEMFGSPTPPLPIGSSSNSKTMSTVSIGGDITSAKIQASNTAMTMTNPRTVHAATSYTSGLGTFNYNPPARMAPFTGSGPISTNRPGMTPYMPGRIGPFGATGTFDNAAGAASSDPHVMSFPVHCIDEKARGNLGFGQTSCVSKVYMQQDHLFWVKREPALERHVAAVVQSTGVQSGLPSITTVHPVTWPALACEIANISKMQLDTFGDSSGSKASLAAPRQQRFYYLADVRRHYVLYGVMQGTEKPFEEFGNLRDTMATSGQWGRMRMANVWADNPLSYRSGTHLWVVWKWVWIDDTSTIDASVDTGRSARPQRVYAWLPFAVATARYSDMTRACTYNDDPELGTQQREGDYDHVGQVMTAEEGGYVETKGNMRKYLHPTSLQSVEEQAKHIADGNRLPRILIFHRVGAPCTGLTRCF